MLECFVFLVVGGSTERVVVVPIDVHGEDGQEEVLERRFASFDAAEVRLFTE